jgi:hypothetical protein
MTAQKKVPGRNLSCNPELLRRIISWKQTSRQVIRNLGNLLGPHVSLQAGYAAFYDTSIDFVKFYWLDVGFSSFSTECKISTR